MNKPEVIDLAEAKRLYPTIWTIFDHPPDFPEHIVVRAFYSLVRDHKVFRCHSLIEARDYIMKQGGSANLMRDPLDDPLIIESWL